MALSPGTRLGAYEIVSLLGAGGMGEVYRAKDMKLGRDVALKLLPDAFTNDPERLARFRREAQVLASLNHPHIGGIYGLEDAEGVRALVLELVEGLTLADRIAQGPIPLDEALPIARQIAEALEAAHENGIIHRDLKPANVKVRVDGTVKVLDFGLAKALDTTTSAHPSMTQSPTITTPAMMTGVGVILGTAAYMSPEQAKGKPVDKRADVWAFGAVFYEMLTGERAFPGEDVTDTLAAVVKVDPKWDAVGAAVPARVLQTMRVCLQKDPGQRVRDIHDVRLALEGAFEGAASHSATPARAGGRLMWSALTIAAVLIIAMAVPTMRHLSESTPELLPIRFEVSTPPTDDPLSFAISPDGRQLAFVATREGEMSRLWIRPLDQTSAQPLPGTERATYPFWAPDSRALGFFADGRLKRIDLLGGTAQVVAEAADGRGGTWNRDDIILFAPHTTSGLARVSATGGPAAAVAQAELGQPAVAPRWPQFLPDGRHFLFFLQISAPETRGVYLGSLDGGKPTRVLATDTAAIYVPPGYLLAVRQERLVAWPFDPVRGTVSGDPMQIAEAVGSDTAVARGEVSASSAGVLAHRVGTGARRRRLVWVDRAGGEIGTPGPVDTAAPSSPELSPDGRRVAVVRIVLGNTDVWLMDLARGVQSRFTSNPAWEFAPLWSLDGRRIVFTSGRSGGADLFERPTDGIHDEQPLLVTTATEGQWPLSWSPDGRVLLYLYANQKSGPRNALWALPLTGDRKPFPVVESNFDVSEGQFSPDGHWVAYTSNTSGRPEVSVRPFQEPGETVQVSTSGGSQVRWRRDGRELYYISPDARLMAVPITPAKDRRTLDVGAAVPLFTTRLAIGPNVVGTRPQYAVAPDRRFLLNVRVDEDSAPPITIVQNWTAALKK